MAKRYYRWWQGVIAGPLVAAALWLGNSAMESMQSPVVVVNLSGTQFAGLMAAAQASPDRAQLVSLRIDPPVDGRTFVSGRAVRPSSKGMVEKQFEYMAPVPFTSPPLMGIGTGKRYADVRAYLAEVAPKVEYTYAWWAEPQMKAGLLVGAPVVGLGVVLPLVMEILMRLGIVARPPKREKAMVLPPAPEVKRDPPPAEVTAADQARLDATLEHLRGEVGDVPASPAAAVDASGVKVTEVRALTGGPVEAVAQGPAEEKDFDGGVYYPVHRPKKKDE